MVSLISFDIKWLLFNYLSGNPPALKINTNRYMPAAHKVVSIVQGANRQRIMAGNQPPADIIHVQFCKGTIRIGQTKIQRIGNYRIRKNQQ